jgi:shikimate dehydrogenase
LAQQPQQLVIANRTLSKAESIAFDFRNVSPIDCCQYSCLAGHAFDVIINATSASLSADLPQLPAGILAAGGSCYDLAYAKEPTPFVRWGRAQNAGHSLDGLGMLVEQAAEAFTLWRGIKPDTAPVIAQLLAERSATYH